MPVLEFLVEVRERVGLVEVDFAESDDGDVQLIGDFFHEGFGDEHPLRAAEATEGGVGDGVGLGDAAADVHVGDEVAVVDVGECSVAYGAAEILGPSGVAEDVGIEGLEFAVLVDADFPSGEEWVSLAGSHHVFVAVEHTSDGALGLVRRRGTDARELNRSSFLPSKATAETFDLGDDFVGLDTGNLSNVGLTAKTISDTHDEDDV